MTQFDPHAVRPLFPALAEQVAGRPAVFFDAPGGTQVPQSVIDAIGGYLAHSNANTHGAYLTSRRTDAVIAGAHQAMADMLGCAPEETVFGPNMTTLTFALSRAIGRELGPGDEIVLTRLDHDANFSPWKALAERGVTIREVDVDVEDCTLDMADMAAKINERTKLVAVGFASNAVGTINDVRRVVEMAHSVGALAFVDAVHYGPHGPIDVRALDCDFLACSVYKFFGPHIGCLYGKAEHLERLQPYKLRPSSDESPDRWMTGTQNHECLAGVTAAVDYLASLGGPAASRREAILSAMTTIQAYERTLSERLISGLLDIPGLTFYGIREAERFDQRTPTVAFRMAGHTPREVAEKLGDQGIFVWDGNYYAINLTERLGVEDQGGMVRVGLAHYATAEEVDRLLAALRAL
ncbi:cysteine desulfurase-like protein [Oscillochloris sp. ZM17-4]|uniref:cysteine desulfurase-like protein n=1 Tax=Oscillochloris sp. ZM17-4 TaxID=2866714 RepID=UPI001C732B2B|nr:cysteine desulfurase-like protein [Oscillochloris sp. ZM17-4]MBX0330376.1 cysteine desulfurase-like protein [Oscillochloris sp. ZM17-4]